MASDVFGIVGTTVVGAFQVEAVVAEGGFAVVYRAYHAGFRAPVALKCLKIPQYLSDEDQFKFEEQFHAEAELLFKLSGSIPTVVRPLHVEAVVAPDGSFMPFLALEWLDGETLAEASRRRRETGQAPPKIEAVIELLNPVARALERAHNFEGPEGRISIVHADVKPENVFLARVGGEQVVKILDFGIGKAKSVASQVAGRVSEVDGGTTSFTPAYGAPEQWSPKHYGQTGPWTDVWGLALTVVEVLAGRPVIDGDHAAMMGTALDPERRPTPRSEGVTVSSSVEAVFQRALAVDPRLRFPEAGQFWDALLDALGVSRPRDAGRSGSYPSPRFEASDGAGGRERHGAPSLEFDMGELSTAPGSDPGAASAPEPHVTRGAFVELAPAPVGAPLSARAVVPESLPPPPRLPITIPPSSAAVVRAFLLPGGLVVAGILITLADEAYAAARGVVFTLGPVRLGWVAGATVVGGIALAVHRAVHPDGRG